MDWVPSPIHQTNLDNRFSYVRFGYSGNKLFPLLTFLAKVPLLAALKAARSSHITRSLMWPTTLFTLALAVMTPKTWIRGLELLSWHHCSLNLRSLPLLPKLQLKLLFLGRINHLIKYLTGRHTDKLSNFSPQHNMIPHYLYLPVNSILWNR